MCLEIDDGNVRIATQPIQVFKLARVKYDGLYAPYQRDFKYTIGETLQSELIVLSGEPYSRFKIEVGLHSLVHFDSATYINSVAGLRVLEILECEIPTGAEYYRGKWSLYSPAYQCMQHDSIASNQIRIIRVIK